MKNLLTYPKADRAIFPLLLAIGVFVFLALPLPSFVQTHVKALGPTVVWAGSPDETLKPPPNPPPKAASILEAVLYRGELPRADAARAVGAGERHARRVVSALMERGVLTADSPRAPVRLVFPAALASRWMPGLFPEQGEHA